MPRFAPETPVRRRPSALALLCAAGLLAAGACALAAPRPAAVLQEIVVEGNTRTRLEVVERVLGLAPGDTVDLGTIDRAWDRLEDCGYFAFVDLTAETDGEGRATLYVELEEDQTTRYTPYLRYSPRHDYLLGAALREINLRGRGDILELQAIAVRIQRGRATWTRPWLWGQDRLSLQADLLWEQGPFVWRSFDYAQGHARLALRRHLSDALYVQLAGGFESFRQKDAYERTLPDRGAGPGAAAAFPAATRDGWLVEGLIGLDTRDNPYYPHRGLFHEVGLGRRTGDQGRDALFATASLRAFVGLPGPPILALHAHGRSVDQPVPVELGLFWGGAETVRGLGYASLEGEHGYLLSAELRWPLFLLPVAVTGEVVGLGLHAFCDAGDAWFDGADPGRARLSVGLGAHLSLLTWQLRFEAARERDGDWMFQFMDVFNF